MSTAKNWLLTPTHSAPAILSANKSAVVGETQDTVKKEIGSLFRGNKAVCGALRTEELCFLFPEGSGAGSAALMPLSHGEQPLGLIAVGSADANHYHKKVGTLFLSHIADVMVKLLARLHYSVRTAD